MQHGSSENRRGIEKAYRCSREPSQAGAKEDGESPRKRDRGERQGSGGRESQHEWAERAIYTGQ